MPDIKFIDPVRNFQNALERKLYTYNTGNATISYLGWLKGYHFLSEAANDPEIREIADGAYREMGAAMMKTHGFEADEQREYAATFVRKFQDATIIDPLSHQIETHSASFRATTVSSALQYSPSMLGSSLKAWRLE